MKLPFTKMQGIGNDFIVIDELRGASEILQGASQVSQVLDPHLAKRLCDRRNGIGADQILWIRKPEHSGADARMEILNADGSTAEMCGNGIRAVGLYLHDHGPKPKQSKYQIETLAGVLETEIRGRDVRVNMGVPQLGEAFPEGEELHALGRLYRFFEVNMGNPHAVFFVEEDLKSLPLEDLGPEIENHSRFPDRTNVEFVQVLDERTLQVRVWERGAGITLACGTGACASAVAALATKRVQGVVTVRLPGGDLRVEWAGGANPVFMEGPALEVFRGEYDL